MPRFFIVKNKKMTRKKIMLLAQNISLQRSENKIFSDISLSLGSGQIIVLKGMNGSGKTSLLKTILNIIEPTSGTIYWRGKC